MKLLEEKQRVKEEKERKKNEKKKKQDEKKLQRNMKLAEKGTQNVIFVRKLCHDSSNQNYEINIFDQQKQLLKSERHSA